MDTQRLQSKYIWQQTPGSRWRFPTTSMASRGLISPLHNGIGGRSFTFIPARWDVPLDDTDRFDNLTGADGRLVEFHRRRDELPLWWLRWSLSRGSLFTHLREEDGTDMAARTASAVAVTEDEYGIPFVVISDPLKYAASAAPGYQERINFNHVDRDTPTGLSLSRPGFISPSDVRRTPPNPDGLAQVRTGATHGIEISAWAKSESTALGMAREMERSLAPA